MCATLAQAITSTTATPAMKTSIERRVSPTTRSFRGTTRTLRLVAGATASRRAVMASISAWAAATEVPGARRAKMRRLLWVRSLERASSGNGAHSCASTAQNGANTNPAGITAATEYTSPSSRMVRPTAPGSDPNRDCHSLWEITTWRPSPPSNAVGRREPPVQRRNAEQRQRVLRDTQSEHALDAIVEAHVGAPVLGRPHRGKAARFTAPILEVGPGHGTAAVVHDDDQLVGVGVGQGSQDDAAQRREHRRVGADGHAQHQDDRRADHRRANEAAQRIAHIAPERFERAHTARVTMRLAHAVQSTEGLAGLASRVLLGKPAGSRVAFGQFEMTGDLVFELAIEAALAKERRQPLRDPTHDRAPRNLAMRAVDCSQLTISWRR